MPAARELLLARHGRAEQPSFGDDQTRALTGVGAREVRRLGAHLQTRGWLPDVAVASPATRARVTAETMLEAAGLTSRVLIIEPRIYEASCGELLEVLGAIASDAARVLVVGHNPAIARAIAFLGGASTSCAPGTLARLAMPADWRELAPGCATVDAIVRPAELPETSR